MGPVSVRGTAGVAVTGPLTLHVSLTLSGIAQQTGASVHVGTCRVFCWAGELGCVVCGVGAEGSQVTGLLGL